MVFRNRFRNRGLNLRPVNRIKHVIDKQGGVAAGVTDVTVLADAVDAPVLASTAQVQTGCTINAIYLKVEVNATTSAALANAYLMIAKSPGNNLTLPAPNAVGSNDNKRYIIHQEMIMLQQQDGSNPRTLFNGVIVIPRGYRRMGPDDVILANVLAPGVILNLCIQCHYKEFR